MTHDHSQGLAFGCTGLACSVFSWFLGHIEAINGVMQFFAIVLSICVTLYGAYKLRKK